jgi:hypothetical protein
VVVEARLSILEPRKTGTELGLQVQPACEQKQRRKDQEEYCALVKVSIGGHANGIEPVVNPRICNIDGVRSARLGEGINRTLTKVGIPNRVSDGTNIQGIFDPLFEIALPSNVEKGTGGPQEDDCEVTKMGRKNLLIKILLNHPIVGLEIIRCSDSVPNPTYSGILSKVLAKFWKFSCHNYA